MEVDVEVLDVTEDEARAATLPAQYLIVVTCRDEPQQLELLQRLTAKGLSCKALLS